MRTGMLRALAVGGVALGLTLLYVALQPRGLGWIAWTLAVILGAFVALELVLGGRRRRAETNAEERWQRAFDDRSQRLLAIAEVRRAIDKARRLGSRGRVRHARLAVIGAELLLASDDADGATALLAKVDVDALAPLEGVIVRHARAQARLFAGDVDGAAAVLAACTSTGEPYVDATIALARAALHVEEGDVAAARRALDEARRSEDEELQAEAAVFALVVDAAAEPIAPERSPIVHEVATRLARVGSPVVRARLSTILSTSTGGSRL